MSDANPTLIQDNQSDPDDCVGCHVAHRDHHRLDLLHRLYLGSIHLCQFREPYGSVASRRTDPSR